MIKRSSIASLYGNLIKSISKEMIALSILSDIPDIRKGNKLNPWYGG